MTKDTLQNLKKTSLTPKVYKKFPNTPGVYVFYSKGKPIYIGKSVNLKSRLSSYFKLHLETKTRKMVSEATEIAAIKVTSELESLLLEAKLIRKYMPKYNIQSKDDKHPLYIRITKEAFPRIITLRKDKLSETKELATYGPFPSSKNVRSVLRMIRRIFPYSDHKVGKRPCLYSQIGLCNPCPNEILALAKSNQAQEKTKKYKQNIRRIKKLLDGNIDNLKKGLLKEMQTYSKKQNYEEAAILRNQISRLEYITQPQTLIDQYYEDPNLYEDIREKEAKGLENILKTMEGMEKIKCNNIECFDIAHFQGIGTAASLVKFTSAEADKSAYKRFKIYQKEGRDDYKSMAEVAVRRANHFTDWGRPDLIIVDGGKGQVTSFKKIMDKHNVPVIGLAKRFETLIIPIQKDKKTVYKEMRLSPSPAKNLVQRIRNEAHRFAQAYHHLLVRNYLRKQEELRILN